MAKNLERKSGDQLDMRGYSFEAYKTKKLLESLASMEGRHTELITLFIPPGRQISEVTGNLRQEHSQSSNIKSRTTRHNVQDAIEKVMQRLKLYREPPPTGLSIFCGAIARGPPGTEKVEIYTVIPPEPLTTYLYRCDSRFHLEPLLDMLKERETYAILVMDGSGATFATLKGRRLEMVKSITSGIAGKHRAGGQSARRFERLREAQVNEFYKRVANYASQIFLAVPDLKGVLLGGAGPTKQEFLDGDYLHYALKDKILAVVDTAYVDEQGVNEVFAKAPEILRKVRYVEEKALVQKFLYEIGHDTGLALYGEEEVRRGLKAGSVGKLLLSEALDQRRVTVKCTNCSYTATTTLKTPTPTLEATLSGKPCPQCRNPTLTLAEEKDLVEDLAELAERANVEVQLIGSGHEEGEMLSKSFGGVAAILKFVR